MLHSHLLVKMIMIKIIERDNNLVWHRCLLRSRQSTIKNVFCYNSLTEMVPPKLMITKIWFDLAGRAIQTYIGNTFNTRGQQVSFAYNKVFSCPNDLVAACYDYNSVRIPLSVKCVIFSTYAYLRGKWKWFDEQQMCVFYHAFFHVIVKHD